VIVATKGGHPTFDAPQVRRLSRADIEGDLNLSLQNLQTERIDLYWLHRDDPQRPVEDILETLNDQVKAGKIRYFGCSNWRLPRIAAAREYAQRRGFTGFVANQMLWSYAVVNPEAISDKTMVIMDDTMQQFHSDTGMAATPYSAQAQGWFQRMARGTVGQMDAGTIARFRNSVNERRFLRLMHLMKETGLSVTELVLGYLQSQPFTTIPIVGCWKLDQLRDSMKAGDVRLTPEQLDYLERDEGVSQAERLI
jgi:aryl-alcohol dehydrogenase-like predicted oxidoreductase